MDDKAKELTNQATAICEGLKDYSITTPSKYELASSDLKKAKEVIKAIEERRKEMTRPLDESKKKIIGFFKPYVERLNGIVSTINREMSTFRRKQEEEARKKQEELDKQTNKDDIFTPQAEVEIPKTDIKVRTIWKFKVIDKNKLKPDFLIPDEKSIGEFVRKFKNDAHKWIGEGAVEVYTEETSY